ncbi:HAD-IA family hydrolase [Patescibacteria group bacterium]|nr:HAD-IA family hydrolase [Patescibacteria group bacterium]
MLQAVIFDLNGVFIISPKLSDRVHKDFGLTTQEFLPALFSIMDQVRKPKAGPAFTYWQPYLQKWGINLNEPEFWDYWFKGEVPNQAMINLAKKFRQQGLKIIILSNNFKERAEFYQSYPWLNEIADKIYFSWQTGLVKPDIKAWQLVLTDNNLKAENCLYFDDQAKNLAAAESLNIPNFAFTNATNTNSLIQQYLK